MGATSVLRWGLTVLLAAFFIFAGSCKLTTKINPEMSSQQAQFFSKASSSYWPLNQYGYSAETNRVLVGAFEVFFGLLALCPLYTRLSAFVFSGIAVGALYTHYQDDKGQVGPNAYPAVVALVLSIILFAVSCTKCHHSASTSEHKKRN